MSPGKYVQSQKSYLYSIKEIKESVKITFISDQHVRLYFFFRPVDSLERFLII